MNTSNADTVTAIRASLPLEPGKKAKSEEIYTVSSVCCSDGFQTAGRMSLIVRHG